jgi:hypothetical protein
MFRLIEDFFWDDPPIAALSRDEKLILVCLFTNIHTRPCGIYRIGLDRLAKMVKVPEATVSKCLKHLAAGDLVYYDGLEVCIPGYIRKQRYKGPLMARRVASELSQAKNQDFVDMIVKRYPDFLRMGGFKRKGEEIPSPQRELKLDKTEPMKSKPGGVADLGLFIAEKLKFTGGVKASQLAKLIRADAEGEAGVRKAVERAVKYFETAKKEHWHSFVMAKRFSKFCDFYGEVFSSDEALQIKIEKIRLANEREQRKDEWHKKRAAQVMVGAQRPETKAVNVWDAFMQNFPEALKSLAADFEAFRNRREDPSVLEEKLLALFKDNEEMAAKENFFLQNLAKKLRTPETAKRYRINYIKGKFGIPDMEDGE